ncbi:hypothetical protein SKAU_G00318920 [Synaphobranchus kaupii]|uniref:EGF-like domain-containing protein n=1 Tax=Synaphobranchus kaupii TaxID=118154 RepID=A0A9Q1ILT2_SYNKA|nr:hypothetical protein SKAU_G00318920 [Synaphobranchus kaupii]
MIAGHGEPCGDSDASYCLNGGTCLRIPSVSDPTCVCNSFFKGSRCNERQLFIISQNPERAGLIAAVAIVALLLLVMLAVVVYYACKMWRRKTKSPQNRKEYWRVAPRAWWIDRPLRGLIDELGRPLFLGDAAARSRLKRTLWLTGRD